MASDDTPGHPPARRPGVDLVQTRWGPIYAFSNDQGVSEALRRFGEYAAAEIALYRRLLAEGDAMIDVGCNIGVIARALAVEVPGVRVIGFEPQPDCFRLAAANTLHCDGVTVYPLAASDRAGMVTVGEIDLRRSGNYGALAIDTTGDRPRSMPCPTVRLDAFLAAREPWPRLVKIDAEGMEPAVLRGMTGLAHDRLVVSAEADRRIQAPAVMAALEALGCTCHAAFFRPIATDNPRFDRDSRHCRNLHVHILGFAGSPPDWIAGVRGIWPVRTAAEFDELWGKYLPADAAPG